MSGRQLFLLGFLFGIVGGVSIVGGYALQTTTQHHSVPKSISNLGGSSLRYSRVQHLPYATNYPMDGC